MGQDLFNKAASILAELVQVRRRVNSNIPAREQETIKVSPVSDTAIDPVCGMIVETASARPRSTYDG
jgi:xanthine dehydrogenase accessory factor